MKKIVATAFAVGLAMTASFAGAASSSADARTSFLPENNLKIPIHKDGTGGGLTEAQFNQVLDKVEGIYSPIIAKLGGQLKIERNWTDDTVNAYAQRIGSVYSVSMFGGLARESAVTQDGFALVVCHELGHHLGGAPKSGWATNEGGADYFGALKCLRRVFHSPGSSVFTRMESNDAVAQKACDASFKSASDRTVCLRSAAAGVSLGTLLNILGGGQVTPKLDTPDPSVVSQTDDSHPEAQCRLDTYFQASLCPAKWTADMSDTDANVGACTRSKGYTVGLRPLCWYKPGANELFAQPRVAETGKAAKSPALASLENGAAFSGL